jgi:hypothetical protein
MHSGLAAHNELLTLGHCLSPLSGGKYINLIIAIHLMSLICTVCNFKSDLLKPTITNPRLFPGHNVFVERTRDR